MSKNLHKTYRKTPALALLALAVALLSGCATTAPGTGASLKPQPLPTAPQSPPAPTGGSVFSPQAHVSLFQDHRLWRDGDLVTVNIAQNATASTVDNSQIQRQATTDNSVSAFLGMPLNFGHVAGHQFSPTLNTTDNTNFKGQGQTTASNNIQGQVTTVVRRVEANGVLEVTGRTNVNINGDVRTIEITGYVRPEDIGPDNTVSSNDLADMNVQYVGVGPTQSAHHPPFLQTLINNFWPF